VCETGPHAARFIAASKAAQNAPQFSAALHH
jgi:hypothetical protein